jgi:type VI secretion system secreted protein VgrG
MKIEHEDVYLVEIDAIPADTQFRAESVTAWPRIFGYENGVVDGPAESEYAQIDELGRYNAKFKFDESALKKNGKATTWVRMMQPHGGDIEGFHFPLRKGTEVVFSFLGGDPDRPVISGVVPNAVKPSPVTQSNYTKNVVQTGSYNRLEIEDKAGNEWIRLSTPYAQSFLNMGLAYPTHEVTLSTQDNIGIGAMQALDIGVGEGIPGPSGAGNMTVHVLNNLTTTVDNVDMRTTVSTGNAYLTVTSGTLTETIKGDTKREIQTGNLEIDVDTGNLTTNVKTANMITTVQANSTTTVHGNTVERTDGTVDIHSGGEMKIHTDGGSNMFIEANEVHVTSRADTFHDVQGHTWTRVSKDSFQEINANSTQIIHGNTDVTRHGNTSTKQIGLQNTMFMGFKNTMELSAASTMTLGAKSDIFVGLKFAFEMAIALQLNLSLTWKNVPAEIKLASLKMDTVPVKLGLVPEKVETGASHTYIVGIFVFL